MAKRRVTLSLDGEIYDRVRELLAAAPRPIPISQLIDELLEDWYFPAQLAPKMAAMSPEEREASINKEAVRQLITLTREIEETLRKSQQGEVVKT